MFIRVSNTEQKDLYYRMISWLFDQKNDNFEYLKEDCRKGYATIIAAVKYRGIGVVIISSLPQCTVH